MYVVKPFQLTSARFISFASAIRASTRSRACRPERGRPVSALWQKLQDFPLPPKVPNSERMAQRFQKAKRSPQGQTSTSSVYPDANLTQPKDYWEYESLSVSWGCEPQTRCSDRASQNVVFKGVRSSACEARQASALPATCPLVESHADL